MSLATLPLTWNEFITHSTENPTKLLVIKCGATWCAPCKEIAPFITYLAENYPSVAFYDLNIEDEERESIVLNMPIVKVPTVVFIKNGKILHSIIYSPSKRENDKTEIENFIVDNL